MKKLLAAIALATFVIGIISISVSTAAEDQQKAYFKVKNDIGKKIVKNIQKYSYPNDVVVVKTNRATIEKLKKLKSNLEFLEYADRIYTVDGKSVLSSETPGSNDIGIIPTINRSCTLADVNKKPLEYAIQYMYDDPSISATSGGLGVKIAILDTGANVYHPDISRRIKQCIDYNTGTNNSCIDSSLTSHGTSIASLIAADGGADTQGMWGMVPEAELYIYRTCRTTLINGALRDVCDEPAIISGIYGAVEEGANIISMSFAGSSMSSQMQAALDYAYNHNVLLVAGAGNDGPTPNSIKYPAAYQKVISVGAITSSYAAWFNTSRGLNDGDYIREEREVEVAAPGHFVTAAKKNGCYRTDATGTSFATPLVAGLGAKIWNNNTVSVRTNIQNLARFYDLSEVGDDNITGFGLPTVPRSLEVSKPYIRGRSVLRPGGIVTIGFSVTNSGETTAYDVPIYIYSSGNLQYYVQELQQYVYGNEIQNYATQLSPGQTIQINQNFTYTLSGNYTITVQVDPENMIPELNKSDNIKTLNITIL